MKMAIRPIVWLIVLGGSLASCKSRKSDMVRFELSVSTTEQYCGGAMPSEEILKELETPKVLKDSTVYLASPGMAMEEVQPIKLDKSGKARLKLGPGMYELYYYNIPVEVQHQHPDVGEDAQQESERLANPPCPPDWKLMLSAQFEVIPGQKNIDVNIHRICDPCEEPRP